MTTRDGCKQCPARVECGEQIPYRGSSCSTLRNLFELFSDPITRGEMIRMDDKQLAIFFCLNTDCDVCKLRTHCKPGEMYPLLEYFGESINKTKE